MVKRVFDVVTSASLILLLSPLIATTALLVLFFLGTPVLFRQRRPGREGRPFTIWKFRTMRDVRDADGHLRPDAERLTRLGRFLRRSSLDELPELWNVARGHMSLVGPRPLLMEYLPLYSPEQRRRHEVKPGITGWTQINGRNALTWEDKFRLDAWYVDHRSFWLDLKILVRTIGKVVTGRGVASPGEATTERFHGNAPTPAVSTPSERS